MFNFAAENMGKHIQSYLLNWISLVSTMILQITMFTINVKAGLDTTLVNEVNSGEPVS